MDTYIVSIVVDALELSDETLDRMFAALPDAVPSAVNGAVTVSAPVAAQSAEGAAFALVGVLDELFPGAVPIRLDQDLVGISDIAERTERTRESVRLLVEGLRGPGEFPSPVGTVGDGIRVWPWAVVLRWFKDSMGTDLGEDGVLPETAAVVDACLAARRRPRRAHHATVTWGDVAAASGRGTGSAQPVRVYSIKAARPAA